MRVEISESAHRDVLDGYWFYNRQEPGLGEYFSDTLYGEMASLRLYAGIDSRDPDWVRLHISNIR